MNDFYEQMARQLEVMPEGAKLEWHFQEKLSQTRFEEDYL